MLILLNPSYLFSLLFNFCSYTRKFYSHIHLQFSSKRPWSRLRKKENTLDVTKLLRKAKRVDEKLFLNWVFLLFSSKCFLLFSCSFFFFFFFFFFSFRQGVLWFNNLSQSHSGTAQNKELTPRLFWLIRITLCTKSRKRGKLCATLVILQLFLITSYCKMATQSSVSPL